VDIGRGLSISTATSTVSETGGVGLTSKDSNENPSKEDCTKRSALTPELKGFIERTLVPLLVQRYIEKGTSLIGVQAVANLNTAELQS
jgi:hypothetical protein